MIYIYTILVETGGVSCVCGTLKSLLSNLATPSHPLSPGTEFYGSYESELHPPSSLPLPFVPSPPPPPFFVVFVFTFCFQLASQTQGSEFEKCLWVCCYVAKNNIVYMWAFIHIPTPSYTYAFTHCQVPLCILI